MNRVRIEIASSIDQVDSAKWDALSAGQDFVSHRWLRLAESIVLDYQPSYILAHGDGRLEAAAIGSIGRQFMDRSLQRRLGWALRASPLMRCIVPLSARPGLLLAPRADTTEVLPELLAALRRQALRRRALFISYGQFLPGDSGWPALQAAGFYQHGRETDMTLPITWRTTCEYLAGLRSPDRRKMRNVERRAEREGIQVTALSSPLEHARLLRGLITAVLAHHGTYDMYVPDLFERAHAVYHEDLHVFAAWHSGEIVGCISAVRDGDALIAKWMGLDYPRTWGTTTYRMLLLATVHLAIELGVRKLSLGPTAYETKQDFGAMPEVRFNAIGVVAPIPRWVVGAVTSSLPVRRWLLDRLDGRDRKPSVD